MREPKAAFEIVVATESDIDGILDVFAVEYAGEVDEAERQRFNMERALELCDFAYFDDDAELCLIDLALSSEKCTIIDTSYEDDLFPEQLPCVAQSLESFIDQCFENRRNGGPGQGFRYFWPKFGASQRN